MASSTERVRRHRERLRHRGMRPVQIWVPDVNDPGFAEEYRRQAQLISDHPGEAEDLAWIDAASDELLARIDKAEQE